MLSSIDEGKKKRKAINEAQMLWIRTECAMQFSPVGFLGRTLFSYDG